MFAQGRRKAPKNYTILLIPERSAPVRRFKLSQRLLTRVLLAFGLTMLGFALLTTHLLSAATQARQNPRLRNENLALKTRLRVMEDEVNRIDLTLQRVDAFARRIRTIAQLHDPARNLALQPLSTEPHAHTSKVLYAQGERIEHEDEALDSALSVSILDARLDGLEADTAVQEAQMQALHERLSGEQAWLAMAPSMRPLRSHFIVSPFGERVDPYTDQPVMHKGLDLAADPGAEVLAPGDGTVVFVGDRGTDHGKMVVLDHGFGYQTHFAHLSEHVVNLAQEVKRGQTIAAVGNSGRSTGAHLHYEVRFCGVPQDPSAFMLDE